MEVDVIEYELNLSSNTYDIYIVDFNLNTHIKVASVSPTYDIVQDKDKINHMAEYIANTLGYIEKKANIKI